MNSWIVVAIFTVFLYSSVQSQPPYDCITNNPCDMTGYFVASKGYSCYTLTGGNVLCTCPGSASEVNQPCRLCGRPNSANNVCNNSTGKLVRCLEIDEYGTSFACLCDDGAGGRFATSNANCDRTVTLTTRPTTTTASGGGGGGLSCLNGGVLVNFICHCPSGYAGTYCQDKNGPNLCERVNCLNNGVCAIRNPSGPYEAVCLCRYGTWGDYCELNGTLGFCSSSSCSNGGACKENVVGSTRHAYCHCAAGYNGVKCENRYFSCPSVGKFPDLTMFNQGKYFECTLVGGGYRAEQKSCAKGLRFNQNSNGCTL